MKSLLFLSIFFVISSWYKILYWFSVLLLSIIDGMVRKEKENSFHIYSKEIPKYTKQKQLLSRKKQKGIKETHNKRRGHTISYCTTPTLKQN